MRTNTIDATAFRCLAEYKTLIDICLKLYDSNDSDAPSIKSVDNYLEELINVDTAKEVRELHNKKMAVLLEQINAVIDLTYEPENIVLEPKKVNFTMPKSNVNLKIAKPRNIND